MNPASRVRGAGFFFVSFLGLERKPSILCNQKIEEESENKQKKRSLPAQEE
jgi:hypothetical protein